MLPVPLCACSLSSCLHATISLVCMLPTLLPTFVTPIRAYSNASALWLGMRPADIFVFVFLPPFLYDLSSRIDFYMLKKVSVCRHASTSVLQCT